MKRALVSALACLGLLCPLLLASGCAVGGGGGQAIDADTLAVRYVEALFAGKADEAKAMMLSKYEYKDEFIAHTDEAMTVLSQYEGK